MTDLIYSDAGTYIFANVVSWFYVRLISDQGWGSITLILSYIKIPPIKLSEFSYKGFFSIYSTSLSFLNSHKLSGNISNKEAVDSTMLSSSGI